MKWSFFALVILGSILSCQSPLDFNQIDKEDVSLNSLINEREWFDRTHDNSKLRSSERNKKTPIWSKSYYYEFPFGRALLVPIS